ncbi:hypothetical protein CL614_08170 [archaeon]|nr:hypothetical protein [archaeon]
MTYLTGESSVVHDWTKIDFVNFVYNSFQFNGVLGGPTLVVNGSTILKIVGVNMQCIIDENTTSIDEDLILLGNPKTKFTGSLSDVGSDAYISKYSFNLIGDDNRQFFDFGILPLINGMNNSMTVSGWAKIEGTHVVNGTIIENFTSAGGFSLGYVNAGDLWRFRIDTTSGTQLVLSTSKPKADDTGKWVQITGVWDQSITTMKIYHNGILENEVVGAGTLNNATQPLRIGGENLSQGEMKGLLNNIVIWNTALTDEEVLDNFGNGVPYNVLSEGPKINNILFWSKVGDDSTWNGSNAWTIRDEVTGVGGISSSPPSVPLSVALTYSSRVIDAPE